MKTTLLFSCVFLSVAFISCKSTAEPLPDNCAMTDLDIIPGVVTNESSCGAADGALEVTAQGGEEPYVFKINNGTNQNTGVFTDLVAGVYMVAVTDGKGCEVTVQVNVQSTSGASIVGFSTIDSGCGTNEGALTVEATGTGTLEYKIGSGQYSNSNLFTNLSAGSYQVTVRDETGCEVTGMATIKTGIPFSIIKSIINQNCAVSGCHVAGTGRTDYSKDENIVSNADDIKFRTGNGSMPPAGRTDLSADQKAEIACWVDDGANI